MKKESRRKPAVHDRANQHKPGEKKNFGAIPGSYERRKENNIHSLGTAT